MYFPQILDSECQNENYKGTATSDYPFGLFHNLLWPVPQAEWRRE